MCVDPADTSPNAPLSSEPPPLPEVDTVRQLLDALVEHAAIVDEQGAVLAVNRAWRTCGAACFHPVGFDAGDDYLLLCASPDGADRMGDRQVVEGFHAVARGERDAFRTTFRCGRGDANAWFRLRITRIAGEGPVRLLAIYEDITPVRATERALEELTERLMTSQEEERRRIARDLHDVTAQNIVALTMSLARLVERSSLSEKERTVLSECHALSEQSLREIRTLSYLLHPPLLDDLGLVSAVRWFVGGFTTRSGLRVDVADLKDPGRLPAKVESALYHVVQESLRNVYRHSGSAVASVALAREGTRIVLRVVDFGCGIAAESCNTCGENGSLAGVGIASMRHRMSGAGGTLEIVSGPQGTTVIAAAPASGRAPEGCGSAYGKIPNSFDSRV